MTAVVADPGIPNARVGIIAPPVAELLAASGAATPSISPLPKFSGFLELFLTVPYDSHVAPSAPTPGTAPTIAPYIPPIDQALHLFKKSN